MSRPATQIVDLATAALNAYQLYAKHPDKTTRDEKVKETLQAIRRIAKDIDARTGTTDPTKKKGWHFPWFGRNKD